MKIKLPRPTGRVYRVKRDGLCFWMPANSKKHARYMVKDLAFDMQSSAKLRKAFEIVPGHIGVGYAGIARAKRQGARS